MTITLILGGARSGKSRHAEKIARQNGLPRVYIATAAAYDDEMRARIAAHRSMRVLDGWRTVEEQLALADVLAREAIAEQVVLVDCLTLWLSNLLLANHDAEEAGAGLVAALKAAKGDVVLVSNEVGMGLVPGTPLGRIFRDAQGRLNQTMAEIANRVIFVAAGLPLVLK